jgi:hypothetical protein
MRTLLTTAAFLVFVVCLAIPANATDQALDRVAIDGEEYYFIETPMSPYWIATQPAPQFDPDSTANWKGYTATWEIRDGKLWLATFTAQFKGKPFDAEKMLATPLPTEATWLCGPLHAVNNVQVSGVTRYSDKAQRLFFVDGVLKKTAILDRVDCCIGRVGITLGNRDGFTVIENISAGSPAQKSSQLEIGDIIEAFTDLDGSMISIGQMDKRRTQQFIRGLDEQPLKLHVRKSAAAVQTTVVELKRTLVFDGEFDYLSEVKGK